MERKKKKASGQSQPQTRIEGGLVLPVKELKSIVELPGCMGLAFGLHQKGTPRNVDLKVYAVTRSGQYLKGSLVKISQRGGSANAFINTPMGEVNNYKFEHEHHIKEDSFDFAYLDLEDCKTVLDADKKWVFISGAVRDYGTTTRITGDWFTLTICPYPRTEKTVRSKKDDFRARPPLVRFMDSCPPYWTQAESGECGKDEIIFSIIE